MKKEWFTAKELSGIGELPNSPQGVNAKAKRESWLMQKKLGVQGRAKEYHYSTLPQATREALALHEDVQEYQVDKSYLLTIWVSTYHLLTEFERETVINLLLREGISGFLEKIRSD